MVAQASPTEGAQTSLKTNSNRSPARLISFSGIDGAGKSTQIENLHSHLELLGHSVRVITFWDDVAVLKQFREGVGHKVFKGDKGVGSPDAPIQRRDKNVQSPLVTLFRLGIYILDALSLRGIAKAARHSSADIIIFDRYIYDELANLSLNRATTKLYARSVMKLVPRPDASFILDADPEKAFIRKPEYPLDFLHKNRKAYLTLARILGKMTVIAPQTIAEAKLEVLQACVSALSR